MLLRLVRDGQKLVLIKEKVTEQGQFTARSVSPASRRLLFFHFYNLAPH